MASLAAFTTLTMEDAAAIIGKVKEVYEDEPSIWSQDAHIDALQTNAAWNCAALLQDALITMVSVELGLDQVWDSWLEYHREINGPIGHDLLMKLHNIEYVQAVINVDPSELDAENPDPHAHYFLFVLMSYTATSITTHCLQSPEQALYHNYYIYIKKHLLDHGLDMPISVVREYLAMCGINRTIGELEVVPSMEE